MYHTQGTFLLAKSKKKKKESGDQKPGGLADVTLF